MTENYFLTLPSATSNGGGHSRMLFANATGRVLVNMSPLWIEFCRLLVKLEHLVDDRGVFVAMEKNERSRECCNFPLRGGTFEWTLSMRAPTNRHIFLLHEVATHLLELLKNRANLFTCTRNVG